MQHDIIFHCSQPDLKLLRQSIFRVLSTSYIAHLLQASLHLPEFCQNCYCCLSLIAFRSSMPQNYVFCAQIWFWFVVHPKSDPLIILTLQVKGMIYFPLILKHLPWEVVEHYFPCPPQITRIQHLEYIPASSPHVAIISLLLFVALDSYSISI